VFRNDLLRDRVLLLGGGTGPLGAAARDACAALGATIRELAADPDDEEAVERAVADAGPLDVVIDDAAGRYAGDDPLRAACDSAWVLARAAGTQGMIERGGKLVFLAPPPPAEPTRAALENLVRTLSIEWARYDIRPTTIAPGSETDPARVGELVAFLASEAGDYYSGCRFDLA
jgi:hypothetical protein